MDLLIFFFIIIITIFGYIENYKPINIDLYNKSSSIIKDIEFIYN